VSRIADNNFITKHGPEIEVLNRLIIEMKKLANKSANGFIGNSPINMDRLNECTEAIGKIQQCKEQVRFK